jgi:hypothetical protein
LCIIALFAEAIVMRPIEKMHLEPLTILSTFLSVQPAVNPANRCRNSRLSILKFSQSLLRPHTLVTLVSSAFTHS